MRPDGRICLISLDDPWAVSHGGSLRTRLFIDAFDTLGAEIHVVYPKSPASSLPALGKGTILHPVDDRPIGERRDGRLGRLKRELLPMPTLRGGWLQSVEDEARRTDAQLLHVSQLRAAQYVRALQAAKLWLDQADVWSQFLDAEIAARRGLARVTASGQQRLLRRAERGWASRSAVISTAGHGDARYLRSATGRDVTWLPTAVAAGSAEPRSGAAPYTAGFLANFEFWPNRDAYELLRMVWAPRLATLGWRVIVAGIASDQMEASPDIEIIGPVATVSDFYSLVDVTLAPIRLGGGVKVKVIESLMWKRQVIGTPEAAAGLPESLGSLLHVVDAADPVFPAVPGEEGADAVFAAAREHFSIDRWQQTVARLLESA